MTRTFNKGLRHYGRWIALGFSAFLISILTQAQVSELADTTGIAKIAFDHDEHQFGDLIQGEKAEHVFTFKNTGTGPLILQNVISTCGCTAPDWPKQPIAPGMEGAVKIVFDTRGKIGRQNKIITVRSNAESGDYKLFISAMVLPKKKN